MRPFALLACLFFLTLPAHADQNEDRTLANATLTRFHAAAAHGDWPEYFGLLTEDSIFLGTDATERWDKPTFMAYAKATKGWKYDMMERHINFTPGGNSAWFDELLRNAKYGVTRGTGVMIRTESGWRIAQYNLTFTIPNDLADGITQEIQVFEERQNPGQQ